MRLVKGIASVTAMKTATMAATSPTMPSDGSLNGSAVWFPTQKVKPMSRLR